MSSSLFNHSSVDSASWRILQGDVRTTLADLPERSVQTCVTSPPYFGLRDYGHDGQIGLEQTPAEYVRQLVDVFREVRRALADDGTLWLNLGDSYVATGTTRWPNTGDGYGNGYGKQGAWHGGESIRPGRGEGMKPKDLIGIPWMVAFALRTDGWYLRSDIIWAKPNPMPESVTDRPTKAHEYLFLLSKRPRYFYDADAIREEPSAGTIERFGDRAGDRINAGTRVPGRMDHVAGRSGEHNMGVPSDGRNRRTVWTVATQPFPGAHFATFPPKLIEPCILAGSVEGDTVLDPFSGSGTTGMVALRHGRSYIGCELNPEYVELSRRRITDDAPLLNSHSEVAA